MKRAPAIGLAACATGVAAVIMAALWLQCDERTRSSALGQRTEIGPVAVAGIPQPVGMEHAAGVHRTSVDGAPARPEECVVALNFHDPTRRALAITGNARLTTGSRVEAQAELTDQGSCSFALALGRYEVRVDAGGFRPFEGSVVVVGPTELECRLWPERWIGIDVIDVGGSREARHAGALVAEGFDALGSQHAPTPGTRPQEPEVGTFLRSGHDPEPDRIGYLEFADVKPAWVALRYFGQIVAWEALDPEDWELTFCVAPGTILGALSALVLRAVDERGVPLEGVEACLTADERLRWRAEHCDVETAVDGRLAFRELFGGSFVLTLERERASLHVQRVEVPPSTALVDLGDIVLPALPSLRVQVVNSEGEPRAYASVEVGLADCAYGEDRAFATRNQFVTGEDGMVDVLRPPKDGVLRATTLELGLHGGPPPAYSRIEPIPPVARNGELVRLVVYDRTPVAFEVGVPDGRLLVRDGLGRVHADLPVNEPRFSVALIPDVYSCEHFDASGESLERAVFEATAADGMTVILR